MIDYLDISVNNKNNSFDEPYEYIINTTFYTCDGLLDSIKSGSINMYGVELTLLELEYESTEYNISVNTHAAEDYNCVKKNDHLTYSINVIKYTNIPIGVEFNGNTIFFIKESQECYTISKLYSLDKRSISELLLNAFLYLLKRRYKYTQNAIYKYHNLINFNERYIKKYCMNDDSYLNNYKSILLKIGISDYTYTMQSINKDHKCSVFYIYKNINNILTKTKVLKTFTNPKNKDFFKEPSTFIKLDNHVLKLRLYLSKNYNYNSKYYRKSTDNLNYDIYIIVYHTGNIIGFKYGDIEYYIWKNNGYLKTYEMYDKSADYSKLALDTFKTALQFLFKIY